MTHRVLENAKLLLLLDLRATTATRVVALLDCRCMPSRVYKRSQLQKHCCSESRRLSLTGIPLMPKVVGTAFLRSYRVRTTYVLRRFTTTLNHIPQSS